MFSLKKRRLLQAGENLSVIKRNCYDVTNKLKIKKMYLQVTAPFAFIRKHGVELKPAALLQVTGIRMILPDSVPLLSASH